MLFPVLSFLVVVLSIPLCLRLARRFGLYDEPDDERKLHHARVPYTGGIAIAGSFAAVVTLMWFVEGLDMLPAQPFNYVPIYLYIVEAAFIIFLLGAVDDFKELSSTKKFVFQFLAAIFIILGASRSGMFPEVFSPLQSSVLSNSIGTVITLLWIVGTTNAINMIDGMDGLAGGSALISSVTMGVLATAWGSSLLGIVLFILAGALLGFLLYNRPPARVFMGDTGSMFVGFVLAVCGWLLLVSAPLRPSAFTVPVIILGLPVFDTLLAFGRRLLARRNPFSADTYHIHHMMKRRFGLSTRATVLILYGVTAAYCVAGLAIAFVPETLSWAIVAVVAGGTGGFLHLLGYTDILRGRSARIDDMIAVMPRANGIHRNGSRHHGRRRIRTMHD
jgi:UDP-GlcNAc:undecaprenyl-phosphate/decaprenyl-phosphate GlcNAc-1-phosphate transferase